MHDLCITLDRYSCMMIVQEDICVMQKVDGTLRLVSGAVLFPQRWHLMQKIGMDMSSIHLPVPFYADVIGSAVNHFMEKLKVDKPVWRANWALDDDPTLFQPLTEVTTNPCSSWIITRVHKSSLSSYELKFHIYMPT